MSVVSIFLPMHMCVSWHICGRQESNWKELDLSAIRLSWVKFRPRLGSRHLCLLGHSIASPDIFQTWFVWLMKISLGVLRRKELEAGAEEKEDVVALTHPPPQLATWEDKSGT